ncbi:MAG: hypothetical protein WB799_03605 [Candidatus Sulfotelmatobacter sp.]
MSQVSVLTQHNDNNRTGQNTSETILTTSNVNVSNFGKLFSLALDGSIYAQPLYLPNLTINGSSHNVVYVATENNSVYAFDADDPNGTTLWQVNLGPSVPSNDICPASGQPSGCYTNIIGGIGITGTPVIDPVGGVLYAAAKNKDSDGTYHYRLHALNVSSGAEMFGGPAEISAGNFEPLFELNRPGLLLSGGNVYIAFGSEGDTTPWYGFVMVYNASTLAQVAFLNTSPSLISGGSIWGGGQGPVADDAGNVYVITANGDFNANTGGSDYSTSFLKLGLDGSNLSVLDYFTPYNQSYLGSPGPDVDLGAGGPLLIPGTTLLLGGGKDGILRLVDSTDMGKYNASGAPNNDVQEWQALSGIAAGGLIMGGPVYWNSPSLGPVVYLWGAGQAMQAWSFNGQTFQTSPVSQGTIANTAGYSNMAPLSISSNGSTAGTGIVWAAASLSGDANAGIVPGQLWAFDASNLTNELWDSQLNSSRDGVGNFAKYDPPTVANGKVYLATFSGQLLIYGLLASFNFSMSSAPSSQSVVAGSSASYIVYVNPQAEFAGTVIVTCSGLPSGSSCSPASVFVQSGGGGQLSVPLIVTTTASNVGGPFSFTITGTSGTLVQTTTASLTVTAAAAPSFALTAAPLAPATVTPGGSATSTVTITPSGGFNSTVNLTCTVTPVTTVPPTCSLSSATVNGGSGTPTLTVSTAAATASVRPNRAGSMFYAMLLPLCGLTLLGATFRSRSRKRLGWLLVCLMLSLLIWLTACSGGSSPSGNNGGGGGGTTAGSYSVTVTGKSGALTQTTQPMSVTVQ